MSTEKIEEIAALRNAMQNANENKLNYAAPMQQLLEVAAQFGSTTLHSSTKADALAACVTANMPLLTRLGYNVSAMALQGQFNFMGLAILGLPYAIKLDDNGFAHFDKVGRSEYATTNSNGNALTDAFSSQAITPDLVVIGSLTPTGEFDDLLLKKPFSPKLEDAQKNSPLKFCAMLGHDPDRLAEEIASSEGYNEPGKRYEGYALIMGYVERMYLKGASTNKNEDGTDKWGNSRIFSIQSKNWVLLSRPIASWSSKANLTDDLFDAFRIKSSAAAAPAPKATTQVAVAPAITAMASGATSTNETVPAVTAVTASVTRRSATPKAASVPAPAPAAAPAATVETPAVTSAPVNNPFMENMNALARRKTVAAAPAVTAVETPAVTPAPAPTPTPAPAAAPATTVENPFMANMNALARKTTPAATPAPAVTAASAPAPAPTVTPEPAPVNNPFMANMNALANRKPVAAAPAIEAVEEKINAGALEVSDEEEYDYDLDTESFFASAVVTTTPKVDGTAPLSAKTDNKSFEERLKDLL